MSIKEQKISLFIVPGVPEDYPFKTRTRKEISVRILPAILHEY
jgi:mRNA-decapping enzyme subunit 2